MGRLIVGWPLNMNGSVGSGCDSVRDFVHEFLKIRQLPIVLQDERLSHLQLSHQCYQLI